MGWGLLEVIGSHRRAGPLVAAGGPLEAFEDHWGHWRPASPLGAAGGRWGPLGAAGGRWGPLGSTGPNSPASFLNGSKIPNILGSAGGHWGPLGAAGGRW